MMNQNKHGAGNSFDKEFSLDNKKRPRSVGGKIPPWAWIILAAALIAAVVIVNKPTVRNAVNTPSVSSAALNAAPAGLNGDDSAVYGDPQVSAAEMEAFLASAQRPVAKSADGDPVFMVEETPFAMRLVPAEALPTAESTAEPEARQTLVINGKTYVIQIHEVAAGDESSAAADSGTINLDGQSVEIGLNPVNEGEAAAADTLVINGQTFRLVITPAAAEAAPTAEPEAVSGAAVEVTPDDDPFAADSAANEPTVEALTTEVPQEGNWFVRMFNTVFGANASVPTPTATSVVTVIPQDDSSADDSAAAAEPVRLDDEESALASKTITLVDKGDLDDAPLYDDSNDAADVPTPTPTKTVDPEMIAPVMLATKAPTAVPSKTPLPAEQIEARPTKIEVTVAAELPHTGGAEDWNIPLMIAALAVLVLIVFAARRLRSSGK